MFHNRFLPNSLHAIPLPTYHLSIVHDYRGMMPGPPREAVPPERDSNHDTMSCTPQVCLRVYHHFERPRNGRAIFIPTQQLSEELTVTASSVNEALTPYIDSTRYIPHIYDGIAECYVPLPSRGSIRVDQAEEPSFVRRIDIRLLPSAGQPASLGVPSELANALLCDSANTPLCSRWFAVGIARGKTLSNHGSLWRTALQLGASMVFTIGARYNRRVEGACDVYKTSRQIPSLSFEDTSAFIAAMPSDAVIVAVEYGGVPLDEFEHPRRAVYVLGGEDSGVPPALVAAARWHVAVPTAPDRPASLNVAAAGAIVLYDRFCKQRSREADRREADGRETDREVCHQVSATAEEER